MSLITLGGSLIAGGLYNLTGSSPARTPNPITDVVAVSGHSLLANAVNAPAGGGFPYGCYGDYLAAQSAGTPDITIETPDGSSLYFRRNNVSNGVYDNMSDYEIIIATDRNDNYPRSLYPDDSAWYHTYVPDGRASRYAEVANWFSRSQTVGNGGAGADFFYFTSWLDQSDYNANNPVQVADWRARVGHDEQYHLDITEAAENTHGSGSIWIIPGNRIMMDIYDDAANGDVPNVANASAFLSDPDWWADSVHQGPLMSLAHCYMVGYVVNGIDPRGQITTGMDLTKEPDAAEATYIQNRVYDTIQAYPRAGVVA